MNYITLLNYFIFTLHTHKTYLFSTSFFHFNPSPTQAIKHPSQVLKCPKRAYLNLTTVHINILFINLLRYHILLKIMHVGYIKIYRDKAYHSFDNMFLKHASQCFYLKN